MLTDTMANIPSILDLPTDVLNHILDALPLPTLLRLRSTCRLADNMISGHIEHRIQVVLANYIRDQEGFFRILTTTSSVVSGSAAYAVCAPQGMFTPGDVDIYTPMHEHQQVVDYLVRVEGYEVVSVVRMFDEDAEYHGGLEKTTRLARDGFRVDVVESATSSSTLPIGFFWCTTVMTFITGSGICVLYPRLLEDSRGLFNPERTLPPHYGVERYADLISKYNRRGVDIRNDDRSWDDEEHPQPQCTPHYSASCPLTVRWVGDTFSLVTSFGTAAERCTAV